MSRELRFATLNVQRSLRYTIRHICDWQVRERLDACLLSETRPAPSHSVHGLYVSCCSSGEPYRGVAILLAPWLANGGNLVFCSYNGQLVVVEVAIPDCGHICLCAAYAPSSPINWKSEASVFWQSMADTLTSLPPLPTVLGIDSNYVSRPEDTLGTSWIDPLIEFPPSPSSGIKQAW